MRTLIQNKCTEIDAFQLLAPVFHVACATGVHSEEYGPTEEIKEVLRLAVSQSVYNPPRGSFQPTRQTTTNSSAVAQRPLHAPSCSAVVLHQRVRLLQLNLSNHSCCLCRATHAGNFFCALAVDHNQYTFSQEWAQVLLEVWLEECEKLLCGGSSEAQAQAQQCGLHQLIRMVCTPAGRLFDRDAKSVRPDGVFDVESSYLYGHAPKPSTNPGIEYKIATANDLDASIFFDYQTHSQNGRLCLVRIEGSWRYAKLHCKDPSSASVAGGGTPAEQLLQFTVNANGFKPRRIQAWEQVRIRCVSRPESSSDT
jgi:hypothetical protein